MVLKDRPMKARDVHWLLQVLSFAESPEIHDCKNALAGLHMGGVSDGIVFQSTALPAY